MTKENYLYIGSGLAKGRRIKVPTIAKPVKNIVKESIFSTINTAIQNKNCLDLFSGSGILGIESISRGAKSCVFIDQDKDAITDITANIASCGFNNKSQVIRFDSVKYIVNSEKFFNIIFLDAPYNLPITYMLKNIYQIATKNCVLIILRDSKEPTLNVDNFSLIKDKIFGKTKISYFALDKHR